MIAQTWPSPDAPRRPELNPRATNTERFYDMILELAPRTDGQRLARTELLKLAADLGRTR